MSERPAATPDDPKPLELAEKGRRGGQEISLDRRLFMKFTAFGGCADPAAASAALAEDGVDGALYVDAADPHGIGVIVMAEDPAYFVTTLRALFNREPFASYTHKPEFDMLGRTYSIGYEPDLTDTLVHRPRRTVLNPAWRWAIWYPLRRSGKFAQLEEQEQRTILAEHGAIGMTFGAADYAHDVRLACHGLDRDDNDFVIGLIGKELFPLSAVVQSMRKTQQTALYLDRLGPFFVGRAAWQSADSDRG